MIEAEEDSDGEIIESTAKFSEQITEISDSESSEESEKDSDSESSEESEKDSE
jgi:hypothetical protein